MEFYSQVSFFKLIIYFFRNYYFNVNMKGYYRYLFAKSRFFESKFWYVMHFPVMLSVICLSLMGMLLIFIERGWDIAAPFRSTFRTVHCTFGFVTIGLSLFQVYHNILDYIFILTHKFCFVFCRL